MPDDELVGCVRIYVCVLVIVSRLQEETCVSMYVRMLVYILDTQYAEPDAGWFWCHGSISGLVRIQIWVSFVAIVEPVVGP
jgi:hypothetical protein